MVLIYILIVLFVLLICYQNYLAFSKNPLVEGLENNTTSEYKPYNVNDPNNALILGQQNAGNIEVLKGQIDGFDEKIKKIPAMQQQIDAMQQQMNDLVQQQANYATEIAGGDKPPEITGTEPETA